MLARHRLRAAANWINLSTPIGLVLAHIAADGSRRTRSGVWLAHGYRLPVPAARAFTLGGVVLLREGLPRIGVDPVGEVPRGLLDHEERHVTQYALFGGVLMPVLYLGAAGWSWLRTGDFASRNPFERAAGLSSGGYREAPVRSPAEAGAALRALLAAATSAR